MATSDYLFVCPNCGGHDLYVFCEVPCRVIQEGDGEFETQPDKHADWDFDEDSIMYCQDCDLAGEVRDFETKNTPESCSA